MWTSFSPLYFYSSFSRSPLALGRLRFCSLRLNRISCESIRHQLPRHYSTQPYSIHTIRFPGLSRWKIKGLLLMLMQSNVIQPPTKEGGEGVALATTVYVHTPLPPQHRRTRTAAPALKSHSMPAACTRAHHLRITPRQGSRGLTRHRTFASTLPPLAQSQYSSTMHRQVVVNL